MNVRQHKTLTVLFYIVLALSLALTYGAMYVNLVIEKNFYQFSVEDERPDPFKPFLYNKNDL